MFIDPIKYVCITRRKVPYWFSVIDCVDVVFTAEWLQAPGPLVFGFLVAQAGARYLFIKICLLGKSQQTDLIPLNVCSCWRTCLL